MPEDVFINEIRVETSRVKNLSAFRCLTSGLSSGHKKRIEQLLHRDGRVGIFEGDALFYVVTKPRIISDEKAELSSFLKKHIRNYSENNLLPVDLNNSPERVVERILFALISFQAAQKGIFVAFGRTFFKPTQAEGKLAHKAVDTTLKIEGDFIKMYLTPTYIGLVNILDTYRSQRFDLELVNLCQFRTPTHCGLAKSDGSCPYVVPGKLGYYSKEVRFESMAEEKKSGVKEFFKNCPKIFEASKYILVKATRKANNSLAYPAFVVQAGLSKEDLTARAEIKNAFRKATLMWSRSRYDETLAWIRQIFTGINQSGPTTGSIQIDELSLPFEIILVKPNRLQGQTSGVYQVSLIEELPVIIDKQDPQPKPQSGAWLFNNNGSYDRQDINRPFDHIYPYLIVKNDTNQTNQVRELFDSLTDKGYKAKSIDGDYDFPGVNTEDGRRKYNVNIRNIITEEENIYFVDGSEQDYLRAAQDIRREWNALPSRDPNRIAIAIIPEDVAEEKISLYHKLKKIFVEEGIPSQFITQDTLKGIDDKTTAFGPILQSMWLNVYAKMGGKPWRLANPLGNIHCFIGIGFGLNPQATNNHIFAGVAHVFDRYGSWIDLASDTANVSASDLSSFEGLQKYVQGTSSFKISEGVTQRIVYDALKLYQQRQTQTQEPPRNIVLHKLGQVYESEVVGFLEGIRQTLGALNGCRLGIVQIEQDHQVKLYGDTAKGRRKEDKTVFRGTSLQLNEITMVLATTGRYNRSTRRGVQDYYAGIGTPQPLLLTSIIPEASLLQKYGCGLDQFYDINTLSAHIMALTQLHWGSIKDNVRLPITALYAHKVADLISKTGANLDTWLSYHRPWFL